MSNSNSPLTSLHNRLAHNPVMNDNSSEVVIVTGHCHLTGQLAKEIAVSSFGILKAEVLLPLHCAQIIQRSILGRQRNHTNVQPIHTFRSFQLKLHFSYKPGEKQRVLLGESCIQHSSIAPILPESTRVLAGMHRLNFHNIP
ncbi:hypothetical protein D3C75_907510 [compost metagenome]